jgi:hypothetical protein
MSYLGFLIYTHDTIIIGGLMSYLCFLIYMHDTIIIEGLHIDQKA